MSTELAVVNAEQRELIKKTIAPDATDTELELFFYDNKRRNVHPLDRLIHFTKRGGKYTPVTSVHFMRAKADEGGRAGQDQPVFVGEVGKAGYECAVTVYKMLDGQRVPYIGVAKWTEFYPGDQQGHMWRKMPSHMLAKCAEANALRLAFPRELAGLHVEEEVHVLDDLPERHTSEQRASEHAQSIAEQSQPATQGQRLVNAMEAELVSAPTQVESLTVPTEQSQRDQLTSLLKELNLLKGGEAFIRGLRLPSDGVPTEQLPFYVKQLAQGIENLKKSAPKK